jgi:hypothetical protein
MVDLVSISFVKSLGLSPCDKKKHQHEEPEVEGIGRIRARTYGFFHLQLCMTDQWNHSIRFTCPFLAIDRGLRDSQVPLRRPALKNLSISINNINNCWEIKNLPRVKPVSPSQFDREILDGAQVFEVWVAYRPVSKDCDEGQEGKRRGDLAVPTEERKDDRKDRGNCRKERHNGVNKINKNLSSGERRRRKRNCTGG